MKHLAVLLSLNVLIGCATIPAPPQEPAKADPGLLQPCLDPEGSAETNSLLSEWFLAYKRALRECNNQITTFKESSNGRQKHPTP